MANRRRLPKEKLEIAVRIEDQPMMGCIVEGKQDKRLLVVCFFAERVVPRLIGNLEGMRDSLNAGVVLGLGVYMLLHQVPSIQLKEVNMGLEWTKEKE